MTIDVDAADDSGEVDRRAGVCSARRQQEGRDVEELTDTTFSVIAAPGAVYTFTYRATDAAGNSDDGDDDRASPEVARLRSAPRHFAGRIAGSS